MQITINDENRQFSNVLNISDLIRQEGLDDQPCAIALNGVFVPRTHYGVTLLGEGDQIEIVSPREGG